MIWKKLAEMEGMTAPPAAKRIKTEADEAERKKRERAEKFKRLKNKKKESDAVPVAAVAAPIPWSEPPKWSGGPPPLAPPPASRPTAKPPPPRKVNLKIPAIQLSAPMIRGKRQQQPWARQSPESQSAFENQDEHRVFDGASPIMMMRALAGGEDEGGGEQMSERAGEGGGESSLSEAGEKDSLDQYMRTVDKQMNADVLHTLNKLAKFQRKEEKEAAAKKALRDKEAPKTSITLSEILASSSQSESQQQQEAAQPSSSKIGVAQFMSALREHELQKQQLVNEKASSLPAAVTDLALVPVLLQSPDSPGGANDEPVLSERDRDSILLGVDDDENQQGALDDFLSVNEEPEASYFDLLAQHGSKKELQLVDHSKIDYEPFEKNLYVQVREIGEMKDHEVEALRRTNGNIRVRGKGCPRPIREFSQCGVNNLILEVLEKRGCEAPFPIQMQAIPALMAGRNVIGVAETGSGKTLAYLLPLLRHVLVQRRLREGEGPIGLIIGPTRELVQQIAQETNRYCKVVKLRCALVYGGGGIGTQLSELKRGADIVVGTPGRLTEVLTINRGRVCNLRRVTFLVLDEADRMFDLGFGPQVERIMCNVRPDAQKAMFSATFPAHIEGLARKALYKPLEIIVGEKGRTASSVTQYVEVFLEPESKFCRLLKILGEWYEHGASILIFVNRQTEVDDLSILLSRHGYDSLVLHGGQDQDDRELALDDFKHKRRTILIATSIAARGLDVRSVVLVINYYPPDHLEDYVHRIGRTGRAGSLGVAYTFFLRPEEADRAEDVRRALAESGQPVPKELDDLLHFFQAQVQQQSSSTQTVAAGGGANNNNKVTKPRQTAKGFAGRGYKFTEAEKSAAQEAKTFWKKELGIIGPNDSTDADGTKDSDDSFTAGSTVNNLNGIGADSDAGNSATNEITSATQTSYNAKSQPDTGGQGQAGAGTSPSLQTEIDAQAAALIDKWTAAILDPAAKAQRTEQLMPVIRQIIAQQYSGSTPNGQPMPNVSAMVQQALQPLKPGMTKVSRATLQAEYVDPVTNNFVTTLSINDYPAQARHKVSHKETLNRIADSTGAALQVRGVYIDPDRQKVNPMLAGAKELHIEIIAPTQIAAQRAKRELRLMVETIAKKQLNCPGGVNQISRW